MLDEAPLMRPITYRWRYSKDGPIWRLWTDGKRFVAMLDDDPFV